MPEFQPTSISQPIAPSQTHQGSLNNTPTNGHAINPNDEIQVSQAHLESPKRSTPTSQPANQMPPSQTNQSDAPSLSSKPKDTMQPGQPLQQPGQPMPPVEPMQQGQPIP